MKVLILGGTGMLGHKLWQVYRERFDTWVTVRSSYRDYAVYDLFDAERFIGGVDAFDLDGVTRALAAVRPEVVINCIGIVKQLPTAKDPLVSLTINSLFPHRLANLCRAAGIRLIHISTDCVFSGRKGMYTEADVADAEDLYGRTKYLGEVESPGCLTLRTSIVGRELRTSSGLIEWFLSQKGKQVHGYVNALFSGFTTLALARILADILEGQPEMSGVYQVSSERISKHDLLLLARDAFGVSIEIKPDTDLKIDRSLDGSRFNRLTGFTPPPWAAMIQEMATDPTPYDRWRPSNDS